MIAELRNELVYTCKHWRDRNDKIKHSKRLAGVKHGQTAPTCGSPLETLALRTKKPKEWISNSISANQNSTDTPALEKENKKARTKPLFTQICRKSRLAIKFGQNTFISTTTERSFLKSLPRRSEAKITWRASGLQGTCSGYHCNQNPPPKVQHADNPTQATKQTQYDLPGRKMRRTPDADN